MIAELWSDDLDFLAEMIECRVPARDYGGSQRWRPKDPGMIGIVEQTYGRHDHAAINAALIRSIALAFPDEDMVFAATTEHRAYVGEFGPLPARARYMHIDVLSPGGISFRRFVSQWLAIRRIMRQASPRAIILLSSGPETFFASRLIVSEFSSVRFFIVLHGNLNDAMGWRSRDPRRRLFDYRSGLAVARHSRIRLVVLENYILTAAVQRQLVCEEMTVVWPHALNDAELADPVAMRPDDSPIRIAFVGGATKNKGFDKFLDLAKGADSAEHDFRFVGSLYEEFPEASHVMIAMPTHPLTRAEYIRRLREVDFVFLPYSEKTYEFTASGSLLDCISQLKPIISLDFAAVRELAAQWGDIGFICQSMEAVKDLISRKATLSDREAYGRYQANLAAIRKSRTPAGIAPLIRRDLAVRDTGAAAG